MNLRAKTIMRTLSMLALCTTLSLSSTLAYAGDPELAYTTDPELVDSHYIPKSVAAAMPDASPRTVSEDDALSANGDIIANAKNLGEYSLSFYCPCEVCNGRADAKTKAGTTMAEGRTIAVDTSVIPLGSRVYIDGYGMFIAEDTGSAIQGNRIDICVSDHARAYELGRDTATVYLLD